MCVFVCVCVFLCMCGWVCVCFCVGVFFCGCVLFWALFWVFLWLKFFDVAVMCVFILPFKGPKAIFFLDCFVSCCG